MVEGPTKGLQEHEDLISNLFGALHEEFFGQSLILNRKTDIAMSLTFYQVDAFATNEKFSGNPAAVYILPNAADPAWMQGVAMEMNLSETAFLVKQSDGYDLRWFTPSVEVALCGHATLASAHVLWETGQLKPGEEARFHTKSGLLTAERTGSGIELNFPAKPARASDAPAGLAESLCVDPIWVGRSAFDYLVEVASAAEVRALKPDFRM